MSRLEILRRYYLYMKFRIVKKNSSLTLPINLSRTTLMIHEKNNVPEVLNVRVNESKKKSTFFKKIFFQAAKN